MHVCDELFLSARAQVLGANFVAGSLGGALVQSLVGIKICQTLNPLSAHRCWAPTLWRAAWAARWRPR